MSTELVSLCGLGNMGGAIAGRLVRRFRVLAYDVDPQRMASASAAHGVAAAPGIVELARSRIVVLSLPSPAVSHEVIATVAPAMAPGGVIVETGTVNPTDMVMAAELAAPHGIGVIDAAILSGVGPMTSGRATLLVGGDSLHVDRAGGVLDALSATIRRFGPLGSGMAAKVINNAVAHAVMVVLVEAGALAAAAGVPGLALADLLIGPDAGLTRPLTHRWIERILRGDYSGGMPTDGARKDSMLALSLAQEHGVPLFAVQAAHTVYELGVSEGLGRLDYASIALLWERWTGTALGEPDS
jgi:3-hydroxyisobutyrate dehydrogenase-like beta-hydroxyacid dehydrogenase